MQNKLLLSVFFILTTLWAIPAYADCIDPVGVAGELEYNTTANKYEFCNGTNWQTMATTNLGACTVPPTPAPTAEMQYIKILSKYRYCDGTDTLEIDCLSTSLAAGLMGYWKLDETSGTTAFDSSGNGNNGTMNGGLDATNDSVSGIIATGIDFDGVDDNIGIPSIYDWAGGDFSVTFWIKIDTYADYKRLFYVDDQFLIAYGDAGNRLSWSVEPDNVDGKVTTADLLGVGVWTHVSFVYDDTAQTGKFYINGAEEVMSNNSPAVMAWDNTGYTDNTIFLMARDTVAEQDGKMDEVRIYNRALNATEVTDLYNLTNPIDITSGLAGHWSLDETSGSSIADSAGTNTGTWTDGTGNDVAEETTDGTIDSSLTFDTVDDHINAGSDASIDDLFDGGGTLSAWIYPITEGEGTYGRIMSKGPFSDYHWHWHMDGNTGEGMSFSAGCVGGATTWWRTNTGTVQLNQWSHVAIKFDTSIDTAQPTFYVNGTQVGYTGTSHCGASSGYKSDAARDLYIGNIVDLNRTFDGQIDDVKAYSRALTDDEISALYQLGQYCPNPVKFDGTNDFLDKATDLTGITDSKLISGSFWMRTGATPAGFMGIAGLGALDFAIMLNGANDKLFILGKDATSTTVLEMQSSARVNDGNWHHIMFSADMANPANRYIYVDGVDSGAALPNTHINADINFTEPPKIAGGVIRYDGDLAQVWIDYGGYIDLSVLANRQKFFNNGPVNLGASGALPTGTSPDIFLDGDTATWHTNKGAGGGFTENGAISNGLITICDNTCRVASTNCTKEGAIDVIGGELAYCNGYDYITIAK